MIGSGSMQARTSARSVVALRSSYRGGDAAGRSVVLVGLSLPAVPSPQRLFGDTPHSFALSRRAHPKEGITHLAS
jgi:hypothetical protein